MSRKLDMQAELEQWAQTLPRLNSAIPKDSLDRVSVGVALRLAQKRDRRSLWQRLWQPALSAIVTVVIAGWLVVGFPGGFQPSQKASTVKTDLITAFAPYLADSTISAISAEDLDTLFTNEISPATSHNDFVTTYTAIDFDPDTAVEQLTLAERNKLLTTIASDRNLEWSELL